MCWNPVSGLLAMARAIQAPHTTARSPAPEFTWTWREGGGEWGWSGCWWGRGVQEGAVCVAVGGPPGERRPQGPAGESLMSPLLQCRRHRCERGSAR